MIAFSVKRPDEKDRTSIVIGLEWENLDRLKKGEPIFKSLESIGVEGVDVFIYAGKDRETMKRQLEERGLVIGEVRREN